MEIIYKQDDFELMFEKFKNKEIEGNLISTEKASIIAYKMTLEGIQKLLRKYLSENSIFGKRRIIEGMGKDLIIIEKQLKNITELLDGNV